MRARSSECKKDGSMLVATPYRDFDGPPRIISEIRKNYGANYSDLRPKLAGDLLVKIGNERNWWPRRTIVRNGQLLVSGGHGGDGAPAALRLPLRHMSLQAGGLPNSLALWRGQNVILTLQTINQQSFDTWVKAIAIELISQTPLDSIKYLDIFTLANCWTPKVQPEKDCNSNYLEPAPPIEEPTIENIILKCQSTEHYVPVREKLLLFESLCKTGRRVRSTEDVSCRSPPETAKRATSLHDLSYFHKHRAVREICKLFENEAVNKKYIAR